MSRRPIAALRAALLAFATVAGCAGEVTPTDAGGDRLDATAPEDRAAPTDVAPVDAASEAAVVADVVDVAADVPDVATCGGAGQPCCTPEALDASTAACAPSLVCESGACRACAGGLTACGGACCDVTADAMHCGACGRACREDETCASGACVCPAGRTLCAGRCVDVLGDDAHCGTCGLACEGRVPNARARCRGGLCAMVDCLDGFGDCDGDPSNGCETLLGGSPEHCGRCGGRCTAPPGAAGACWEGRCEPGTSCLPGRGDCSASPGCETDTRRDPDHCGACGRACSRHHATPSCDGGACALTCAAGYGDCDGDLANGCETSLRVETAHCGACGRACALPGATAACVGGACALAACDAGRADCDGDPSNGCEVDVRADVRHCGACGRACDATHGTPSCAAGRCAIACDAGWGDCDADPADGCERRVADDPAHCGACGRLCRGDQTCRGDACACADGRADCAGACRATATDAAHCGRCGNACARGQECVGGACVADRQRSCAAPGTPGCGLVEVAGGTFDLGASGGTCFVSFPGIDPATCAVNAGAPQGAVVVSAFAMDAHEVTVGRFRAFWTARAADGGASVRSRPVAYPGGRSIAWEGMAREPSATPSTNWTTTPGRWEAHPLHNVDGWTALEFCVWDGGRLPTEAEWEFAARWRAVPAEGLVAGRVYPWGAVDPRNAPCDRAHWGECPGDDGVPTRRVGAFAPAGGFYDLAGNVAERVADTFEGFFAPGGGGPSACWNRPGAVDPLCRGGMGSVRGGSYLDTQYQRLRAASRDGGLNMARPGVGFRCARSR